MKILQEVKNSPFKPLKRKIYVGQIKYYVSYFLPCNYCPTLISFRKLKMRSPNEKAAYSEKHPYIKGNDLIFNNFPIVRRSKYVVLKLFKSYWYVEVGVPITIVKADLGYKCKYGTPRFEQTPLFIFFFFKWQIAIIYEPETDDIDTYWEMYIWWRDYCNKDLKKAEETWGWVDYDTGNTTWCKNNLK